MSVSALLGPGLYARRLTVTPRDVVFVKGIFEASEGLGALFAEAGGDLVVASTESQRAALDELLVDLAKELGAHVGAELDVEAPVDHFARTNASADHARTSPVGEILHRSATPGSVPPSSTTPQAHALALMDGVAVASPKSILYGPEK